VHFETDEIGMRAFAAREFGEVVLAGGEKCCCRRNRLTITKLNGEAVTIAKQSLDEGATPDFASGGFCFFEQSLVEETAGHGEGGEG
jgi:hypothetical protein